MTPTMAASSLLSLSTFILISSLYWTLICCDESTISASPAVLPYVNAPDMSSFFPTPVKDPNRDRPVSTAVPPVSEAEAPSPSSGQGIIGKSSGSSAQPRSGLFLVVLVSLGVFSFYVLMTTSAS